MNKPAFSGSEKEAIVQKVIAYFQDNLEQEIGGFDAEFLIDFFAEEVGAHFYNRGLHDAHALFSGKVEELVESIYELEQATPLGR